MTNKQTNAYVNADAIKAEYHPYNLMRAFNEGYATYMNGTRFNHTSAYNGVAGQAYDRGQEAAMRVQRASQWIDDNVEPTRFASRTVQFCDK
jgi:hypothetical protein